MGEFTKIETQEQFDAAIGERLKRERETVEKRFTGYMSPEDFEKKKTEYETTIGDLNTKLNTANGQIAGHNKAMAEKDAKIKAYESHSVKTRIANENGLPYEAVDFIKGEDEESIRTSAQALKKMFGDRLEAPLASGEKSVTDGSTAAYRKLVAGLKN